jgi:2-(1,2-epoxy-1,2-dihydrophenyl)acetyl-CoA isomerase
MADSLVETTLSQGTLVVTLSDPARRNPISEPMREALIGALQAAAADDGVRVIVLTGAQGAFSSGGDLSAMPPKSTGDSDARMGRVATLVRLVSESTKPMVAAVEGPAAGVSVGLMAACDFVCMAEGANVLFPFTRLGLLPDGGVMASLSHRIGRTAAKRVLLLGNPVGAAEAVALGLADEATPKAGALPRALEIAAELAGRAPGSVAAVKNFFVVGALEVDDALAAERRVQRELYFSQDFAEGKAAFFAQREPRFTGK